MTAIRLTRSLVRLPAIVFPGQAFSFKVSRATSSPFSLPQQVVDSAWRSHDGRIACFGPGARIGTEVHLMYDHVLDSLEPTPPGVAHAMGGERVRLSRTIGRRAPGEQHPLCEVLPLEDEDLSPARSERLADEAGLANELVDRCVATGRFALEPSHEDEEIGGAAICDPRCHPMHLAQSERPECPRELSLWLASRLPLSTVLRLHMLSILCPLRRLQETVDAMRLLSDPQRLERTGHRFRIVASHPAHDAYCSTLGGAAQPPRLVVTEAPPTFASWTSDSSFPHA